MDYSHILCLTAGAFATPENLENTGGDSSKVYLHVSVVLLFLGDLAEMTEEPDISHASHHITKLLTMSNSSVSLWLKLAHLFPLNCELVCIIAFPLRCCLQITMWSYMTLGENS